MKLLKNLVIAFVVLFSMGSLSSAIAAGKIENATASQVKEAIEAALTDAKTALDGLKNGADMEVVAQHIVSARQATKEIEVGTTLDPTRSKASTKLRAANTAVNKGEKENAEAALVEAIKGFEHIKANY